MSILLFDKFMLTLCDISLSVHPADFKEALTWLVVNGSLAEKIGIIEPIEYQCLWIAAVIKIDLYLKKWSQE